MFGFLSLCNLLTCDSSVSGGGWYSCQSSYSLKHQRFPVSPHRLGKVGLHSPGSTGKGLPACEGEKGWGCSASGAFVISLHSEDVDWASLCSELQRTGFKARSPEMLCSSWSATTTPEGHMWVQFSIMWCGSCYLSFTLIVGKSVCDQWVTTQSVTRLVSTCVKIHLNGQYGQPV